ncbi:hypothetical protein E3O62_14140 [Cryobacterium sp. TMT2-15-1]|uniref:hypothetical protein n=1 Tax=Cryobacterium sp. TMT2-15-1 TaxID=1259246 RepID=UPI00106A327E|nr:hypothetical protein [Cryobacterium sp. TMT2-15-1]TFC55450.1 hypothetical protein E3O62_14140 [Cryobacterium sp. TMT2-15-1]
MSYEEKSSWIYATVAIAMPAIYFTGILGQVSQAPVQQIEYVIPMLTAVGVAILASIVANIVLGIFSSKVTRRTDERDAEIRRRGFNLGFLVFSVLMVVPLIMALAEVPHFWIANTIYAAFALTGFSYSVLKIASYRRGF